MTTMTVLEFRTADGAEQLLTKLQQMQRQQLIQINDAAIVTWPQGRKKPKTQQLHNLAAMGALSGAFWGMLFGLLFFIPFLGLAFGAGMGALMGSLGDVGIDDNFIKQVRQKVTPGTSALFLLTSGAVVDRLADELKGTEAEVVSTNLSPEQEQKLRAAFEEEPETETPAPVSTPTMQSQP